MKIAMAVRQFRAVGGAEKVARRLAKHLVASGHTVDVLAYQAEALEGATLHILGTPSYVPRAARDWVTGRGLANALRETEADVTFGEQKVWGADVIRPGGGVEDEYWFARSAYARIVKHPFIRFMRPKRYFDVWAERRGYAHPVLRRVIVNSRMTRNQLLARYPHLSDRVVVIYNGVDEVLAPMENRDRLRCEWGAVYGMNPGGVWLLFAGHEFKRKGLVHALRALALARANGTDARLLVLGRDRAAPYKRECARLGISAHVAFTGAVPEIANHYALADALILPSHYDPFANVTIEAMGVGLPVITTRQNGGGELVDAEAGWVVENPTAEAAMADAITALADPARRQAMGDAARRIAKQHLLADKMKEIEQVLVTVAEEKRRAGVKTGMHHG